MCMDFVVLVPLSRWADGIAIISPKLGRENCALLFPSQAQ
jgi:hypothetical protein